MNHDEQAYWAEEPVNLILQGRRTPAAVPPATEATDTGPEDTTDKSTEPDCDTGTVEPIDGAGAAPDADAASEPARDPAGGLLADPPGPECDPARWGFRGEVNRLLGGWGRLSPRPAEVEHRLAERAVQAHWSGTQLVMVANPKGGVGKTPATLMLASTFALLRGGGVVGWDNNETRGTLALRAAAAPTTSTVWDLLAHAPQLATGSAAQIAAFLRRQPTREHILASDDSPEHMDQIGWDECADIYRVLARHYPLIVADTGNNERAGNWRWLAHHAGQLVIPLQYREDTAKIVGGMLDRLTGHGLEALVANAIVVVSTPPDGTAPGVREVIRTFLQDKGITAFVEVPHDRMLAGRAGRIVY
uniref:MinD/ParA family ATP-binding protein n=1 Tax=Aldersonia kunmingensis TaxID=408066 RepID=UPI000829A1BC